MKKALIVLLLMAIVVAAIPAVVGAILANELPDAARQQWPDARVDWDGGWLRSRLRIDDPELEVDATFHHLSISPAAWITFEGRAIPMEPAGVIDFSGFLGLAGRLTARASAPSLDVDDRARWNWQGLTGEVDVARDGEAVGTLRADRLTIRDALGNQLQLAEIGLDLGWSQPGERTGRLDLDLSARRDAQPSSRLAISAREVTVAAAAELGGALARLASADPRTAGGGLDALGAASAWQQLVAGGLELRLETLVLDEVVEASGRWTPAAGPLRLDGRGALPTLVDWWSTVLGLSAELRPREARDQVRAAVADLQAAGAMYVEGQRFEFRLPPPQP
ncbi:MAG: hypothetical protein R3323_07345 [Wenzhouxiangellaceae bacterium]|nr:hypothetical protein [Wenzhouxiangellaceae bacterium]